MGFGGGEFMGTGMSLGQFGFMDDEEGFGRDERFEAALREIDDAGLEFDSDYEATNAVNEILQRHSISPRSLSAREVRQIDAHLE